MKRNSSSGHNFKQCIWILILLGRKNGQIHDYLSIPGLSSGLARGSGCGRNMTENL